MNCPASHKRLAPAIDVWFRRISPITMCPDEGPITEPGSGHSARATGTALHAPEPTVGRAESGERVRGWARPSLQHRGGTGGRDGDLDRQPMSSDRAGDDGTERNVGLLFKSLVFGVPRFRGNGSRIAPFAVFGNCACVFAPKAEDLSPQLAQPRRSISIGRRSGVGAEPSLWRLCSPRDQTP
jgi:hypothetical protein